MIQNECLKNRKWRDDRKQGEGEVQQMPLGPDPESRLAACIFKEELSDLDARVIKGA